MVQYCTITKGEKQMITERTLKRWRREALTMLHAEVAPITAAPEGHNVFSLMEREMCERIEVLTRELIDIHLLRRGH